MPISADATIVNAAIPARKCYRQTAPIKDHDEPSHRFALAFNPLILQFPHILSPNAANKTNPQPRERSKGQRTIAIQKTVGLP
jgi:hypothetical protein